MHRETLTLFAERIGDEARLAASGELDFSTLGDFRAAAREVTEGATSFVVDLTRLTFIDSMGLSGLLDLRHAIAAQGVAFSVLTAEGPVRNAFELTGLADLLHVAS